MVIDLIIIAIIVLCIFLGYKRGFIGVAFKFLSFIIAIVLALILHAPVSNFVINNTKIDDNIEVAISKNIDFSKYDNKKAEEIKEEEENLPNVLINQIQKSIKNSIDTAKEDIQTAIAKKLTHSIIDIAILIILFIVVKIALIILNLAVDIISKLPVIEQFNKTGGIVYGGIEGLFIVYVLLAACLMLTPFMQTTELLEVINESTIGSFLYNNNILLKFIR